MTTVRADTATMAKQQRSTQLPGDIFRLTEAFESRTGAKFNRQALAALLQYFFSNPRGPDPQWLAAAVAVERGKIAVGEVGHWVADKRANLAHRQCQQARERARDAGLPDNEIGQSDDYNSWFRERGQRSQDRYEWQRVLKLAPNNLDALIELWRKIDSGVSADDIMHPGQIKRRESTTRRATDHHYPPETGISDFVPDEADGDLKGEADIETD